MRASEDSTMTSENLKQKENRRGSALREKRSENIPTDTQHRRGSEPARNLKRSIGCMSEVDDTPRKESVKKRRINQEAFELMLRAKDILNERIPVKKMLARMQESKCKAYLDEGGQCDIITMACKERLDKEKVEMEEIDREELIPDCIRKMEDMRVRMVKIRATIDEKEMEIYPIILFGRNDAVILGRESAKLAWLQKRRREQIHPMERCDEHIQLPETIANNQGRQDEPKSMVRSPGTFRYVSISKCYGNLQMENVESDTHSNIDTDNTEDKDRGKDATTSKKKRDKDRVDNRLNKTFKVSRTDSIRENDRETDNDRLEDDMQEEERGDNRKKTEEKDEQYETDKTVNIKDRDKREHRHTSVITHVSRERDETDINTHETLPSGDYEAQIQQYEASVIIAGQINDTNEIINKQPARGFFFFPILAGRLPQEIV